MPVSRSALFFFSILLLSPGLAAQQTPQRDSQALTVLSRMVAASGWSPGNIPSDVIAAGTVTRYRGDVQDVLAVTLKAKSERQFRTELQAPSGQTVTVVNDLAGAASWPGRTRTIPPYAALSMRPWAFPFFSDFVAVADANVDFLYDGTDTVSGQLAHRVRVFREPIAGDLTAPLRRRAGWVTVWISATSWLPIQVEFSRIAEDNLIPVITHARKYSAYTVVQGLAVPLRQEEFVESTRLYTLQLTQVNFNVGLPASDFVVPHNGQ